MKYSLILSRANHPEAQGRSTHAFCCRMASTDRVQVLGLGVRSFKSGGVRNHQKETQTVVYTLVQVYTRGSCFAPTCYFMLSADGHDWWLRNVCTMRPFTTKPNLNTGSAFLTRRGNVRDFRIFLFITRGGNLQVILGNRFLKKLQPAIFISNGIISLPHCILIKAGVELTVNRSVVVNMAASINCAMCRYVTIQCWRLIGWF